MAFTVGQVSGSAAQTSGRSEDVWGRRRIGLYRLTPDSSWLGTGEPFNPTTYGFQGPVAAVFISSRYVAANAYIIFTYDHVNKTILATNTSGTEDNCDTDDLSTVLLDVLVIGE